MNRRVFLTGATLSPLISPSSLGIPTKPAQVVSSFTLSIPPPSVDLSRLLDCIAQVESGRNDKAESRRNGQVIARGRYQLTATTWFQHTNRPWKLAHNFFVADEIAHRHVSWLDKNLPPISIDEYHFRPFSLAWCWRGGLDMWKVRSSFPDAVTHVYDDHANRVVNLYMETKP
jgi:hypothetical protein